MLFHKLARRRVNITVTYRQINTFTADFLKRVGCPIHWVSPLSDSFISRNDAPAATRLEGAAAGVKKKSAIC